MSKSVGKSLLMIVTVIFLVLAIVAFVFYAVFAVEFLGGILNDNSGESAGEQLGAGLGVAFALVFMVIFGAAAIILSAVGIALSVAVLKVGYRRVGRVFVILLSLLVTLTVASFAISLIVNANRAEDTALLLYPVLV